MDLYKLIARLKLPRRGEIHSFSSYSARCYHTARSRATAIATFRDEENISKSVGIFWDLDNKPPHCVPPYDAATSLKVLAAEFGPLGTMVAYANRHAFTFVPDRVRFLRKQRKILDLMESRGLVRSLEPYTCEVCGRRFEPHPKFQKHFRQLHEREHHKRVARLESLKGKRREAFRAKILPKEEKYRAAARKVLVPKEGYGLAPEIIRAGFRVRTVRDKPQAADVALESDVVEAMDYGIRTLCLVSDDSDFVRVLREARERNVRTVVVGDQCGGLKRFADAAFSWRDVARGQAAQVAGSSRGASEEEDDFEEDEGFKRNYGSQTEEEEEDEDVDLEGLGLEDDNDEDDDFDEFFRVDEFKGKGCGGKRGIVFVANSGRKLDSRRKAGSWRRLHSDSEDFPS
uniref:TSA: Wollemia nobilis Ref_Wollemi_Transcript_18690_1350 transcribed RNA sequence n=1 Tax=Wollemia nobilis TaxID=56998 RepID=A0A0C9RI97_9CONI